MTGTTSQRSYKSLQPVSLQVKQIKNESNDYQLAILNQKVKRNTNEWQASSSAKMLKKIRSDSIDKLLTA